MTRSTALLWKESRESLQFLLIAGFLFIGMPIIGGLERSWWWPHRFAFVASDWVLSLTPLLAVLLGVYCTCRDVSPKIEDFWQSRPISAAQLFGIKYAVGAAIVLIAGLVPLLIELATHPQQDAPTMQPNDLWSAAFWLAAFSIAFAVGAVVRQTTHAAVVGVVGVLLLVFLPVIFPPLLAFNLDQIQRQSPQETDAFQITRPQLHFAEGMVAVSAVSVVFAIVAVRRGWHIESSKPLIYTALSAAFLILIGSASYQLGKNLPVLSHLNPPWGVQEMDVSRENGKPIASSQIVVSRKPGEQTQFEYRIWPIGLAENELQLGKPRASSAEPDLFPVCFRCRSEVDSNVEYSVHVNTEQKVDTTTLGIIRVNDPSSFAVQLQLWSAPTAQGPYPSIFASGDRLYVTGAHTLVFDVADPIHPKRVIGLPDKQWSPVWPPSASSALTYALPPAPGLSPQQRLQFLVRSLSLSEYVEPAFDGTNWVEFFDTTTTHVLALYRLKTLTEERAVFDRVATYQSTLVQSIVGKFYFTGLAMKNGLLYTVAGNSITVFDLTGPRPLQLVAHFVTNDRWPHTVLPLPDGRCLVGGDGLWLLGPPPHLH